MISRLKRLRQSANPLPALLAATFLVLSSLPASAAVVNVLISLSSQTMTVDADGQTWNWPVSTARRGYHTPTGVFHPQRLSRMWYSRKYDNSPMPWSIFFLGGYAIHGTTEISRLGRPASHGCVRLHPDNARFLFSLVQSAGSYADTLITIRK